MSEHTATAPAADYVDADFQETGLEHTRNQAQLSVRHELSPESLRAEIGRQREMQTIMTEYVRDAMVKDHHYYSFNEGGKPALTKDGAYRICSLFKVIPGPVSVEIDRQENGHFTVTSTAVLFNQDGIEIASSRGIASTRESKYAYRWVNEGSVPKDIDKATLKTRGGVNKNGSKWLQYQLPNPDLADLENTIIKMSEKRATVGAVNKLPLVSELFAADPDDVTPETKPRSQPRNSNSNSSQQRQPSGQSAAGAKSADEGVRVPSVQTAVDLATDAELLAEVNELFKIKCGDGETIDEEEALKVLKGRDLTQLNAAGLEKLKGELAAM